jgi:nucleotide-binding universal stress UspA family protein
MFTKILVAVSTRHADTILMSAIETARKYNAEIVALHVIDPSPCYMGAADYHFGLAVEAMEAHGREVVTHVKNVLDVYSQPGEVRMMTLPIAGVTIGRAISTVAEETGADLILLGERSASRWRWLKEDVTSEVMRCASRPTRIATPQPAVRSVLKTGGRWAGISTARG